MFFKLQCSFTVYKKGGILLNSAVYSPAGDSFALHPRKVEVAGERVVPEGLDKNSVLLALCLTTPNIQNVGT